MSSKIQQAVLEDAGYLLKYIPKPPAKVLLTQQLHQRTFLNTKSIYTLVACIQVTHEMRVKLKGIVDLSDFTDCKLIPDPDQHCYFVIHSLGMIPNEAMRQAYPA